MKSAYREVSSILSTAFCLKPFDQPTDVFCRVPYWCAAETTVPVGTPGCGNDYATVRSARSIPSIWSWAAEASNHTLMAMVRALDGARTGSGTNWISRWSSKRSGVPERSRAFRMACGERGPAN